MGINGIGGLYSGIFSQMYQGIGGNNKKYSQYTSADLQALMKKADEVRSPEFKKKIKSQLEGNSSANSGEVGTVASEMKLSESAKDLRQKALELSSMSMTDIKDKDVLVKRVSDFAESYNKAIDAMGKSDSVDALRAGVSMTNSVKTYSGALSRMGLKVGSDNKLTVNEETLRNADNNAVASIFGSSYSPVARIADKAETIGKAAANKAQTTAFRNMMYGTADTDSGYGGYNTFASTFLGTFFDSYM